MKFKVGDRVAVYLCCRRAEDTVNEICDNGILNLKINGVIHHKQCRLLKKKERRRVWLVTSEIGNTRIGYIAGKWQRPVDCNNFTEFIEAHPSKARKP
jgi:hypothetical protein